MERKHLQALVTGGRGFIGSSLVEELLKRGWTVKCLLRDPHDPGWLAGLNFEPHAGDIVTGSGLAEAVSGVDYVFHLAGLTKTFRKSDFEKVNVGGTHNLLKAVHQFNPGVKCFVLVSSLAAAGPSRTGQPLREHDPPQPISEYGRSKLKAEQVAIEFANDLPVAIVRPPAVFGPRDRDMFEMFKYAQKGWRLVLSGGPRWASLIYVKDLVRGLLLTVEIEAARSQTYFLCNDERYSWDTIGNLLAHRFGKPLRTVTVPLPLALLIFAGFDLFGKVTKTSSLFNLDKFQELKALHWICDNTKAKTELGFRTKFSLEEAIRETAEWYVANGWL
jgi:nucleoside-diphosphate-sugar epimerase